ncbi:COG4705 family protein [Sphingomonas nostoxanthinifaciens]|uniref:hypothetical protein n=1 Tax=Sphingomonas nostoxanthinifaciens TaxID=2872652 RepID=UPI001CC1F68E|nr:hypothetical protein [Sphingomonas nostoxanthinifaciens]UAK25778.1 hypothetical protein K8P63_06515 [Sphingomonas nostoxanthinifaciens]
MNMRLRTTPSVGPRYWTALLIASMCGTNLGDIFPDVLKVGAVVGLAILAALFAILVLVERFSKRGSEAFYWIAILIVRAAATNVADFAIGGVHSRYGPVAAALTALFAILVIVHRTFVPKIAADAMPPTNGFYWFTMLTAGALGTIIGDGLGHAFGPVTTSVPISAGLASLTVIALLGARARLRWVSTTSYWIMIVAVRWWGTNVGDAVAFLIGLLVSASILGTVLAALLMLWMPRVYERERQNAATVRAGSKR